MDHLSLLRSAMWSREQRRERRRRKGGQIDRWTVGHLSKWAVQDVRKVKGKVSKMKMRGGQRILSVDPGWDSG